MVLGPGGPEQASLTLELELLLIEFCRRMSPDVQIRRWTRMSRDRHRPPCWSMAVDTSSSSLFLWAGPSGGLKPRGTKSIINAGVNNKRRLLFSDCMRCPASPRRRLLSLNAFYSKGASDSRPWPNNSRGVNIPASCRHARCLQVLGTIDPRCVFGNLGPWVWPGTAFLHGNSGNVPRA